MALCVRCLAAVSVSQLGFPEIYSLKVQKVRSGHELNSKKAKQLLPRIKADFKKTPQKPHNLTILEHFQPNKVTNTVLTGENIERAGLQSAAGPTDRKWV